MKIYDHEKGDKTVEFEFKIQEPRCFASNRRLYAICMESEDLCDYGRLYENMAEAYDCL